MSSPQPTEKLGKWIFASVCVIAFLVLALTGHNEAFETIAALLVIVFIFSSL